MLTKRQQQVLLRMNEACDSALLLDGMWTLSIPRSHHLSDEAWLARYGDIYTSGNTINALFDLELIASGWDVAGLRTAALTKKGQTLAKLLA